jgi:hypothetical protein
MSFYGVFVRELDKPDHGAMSEIKVAVRVRPFNARELALRSSCIVSMQNNGTLLTCPADPAAPPKQFTFDYSFCQRRACRPAGNNSSD